MTDGKLDILVAAGGTGGHLFPAIAVVEQLEKLTDKQININFIGTENRIESQKIPELGYIYHTMPIVGWSGAKIKSLFLPFKIMESIVKARAVIKHRNIDGVIAAGAYISYPPGIAAIQLNKPLFLMESNVNPGKTIKKLSGKASLIFTSFKESSAFFNPKVRDLIRPYGNPIRESIQNLPYKMGAYGFFNLNPEKKTILVMGGSLGAQSINFAIENSFIDIEKQDYQLLWQTGKNYVPPTLVPGNVHPVQFIEDMASAYSIADLVVCSGATTISEICIAGKPSILIPLPSASNNEQYHNAKVMEENLAGILVSDNLINTQLYTIMNDLIKDSLKLNSFAEEAKHLVKQGSANRVAKEILNFLNFPIHTEEQQL